MPTLQHDHGRQRGHPKGHAKGDPKGDPKGHCRAPFISGWGAYDGDMEQSADTCQLRGRRTTTAFTLIELIVVIAIILSLMGLGIPVYNVLIRNNRTSQTQALVVAIAGAMDAYRVQQWTVWDATAGRSRAYRIWDWNEDGLIDGRPADEEPAITATAHAHHALYRSGYLGAVEMLALPVGPGRADAAGRPLDAWKRPFHITQAAGVYGSSPFGIWSLGADGLDGPPGSPAAADNPHSWRAR